MEFCARLPILATVTLAGLRLPFYEQLRIGIGVTNVPWFRRQWSQFSPIIRTVRSGSNAHNHDAGKGWANCAVSCQLSRLLGGLGPLEEVAKPPIEPQKTPLTVRVIPPLFSQHKWEKIMG